MLHSISHMRVVQMKTVHSTATFGPQHEVIPEATQEVLCRGDPPTGAINGMPSIANGLHCFGQIPKWGLFEQP
jgi:hypothetical protein